MGRPSEGSGPVLIQGPCAALAARRPFCATLGHAGLMPALFLTIYYANPNLGSYSGAPAGHCSVPSVLWLILGFLGGWDQNASERLAEGVRGEVREVDAVVKGYSE